MIQKVKKNGSNYFAVAENGSLISALKVYYAASAAGLKPIIGIDLYFKDEFCSIINGTPSEQAKYFKLLMFFRDQAAYQTMVSMISDKGRKKVKIGEDHEYPLFNWTDLERLSKLNVLVSSSNIEDMVSKHLLFDRPDLSKRYYERLIELFGDRYTPAICPFEHTHYQERLIEFTLIGNKKIRLPLNTRVDTDSKGFKTKAIDIYKNPKRYKKLLRIYYNGLKSTVKLENQDILGVEMVKDFVQIDRGDIQALANKQFIELHGTNLLINDYAYYVDKDDKIVQNMKLGEDGKCLHQDLYIRSAAETALYLKNLGLAPEQIKGVFENTQKWASQFDDFKLKYDIKLVDYGPEPEKLLIKAIKERGRMKWDDPRYVKQLKEELDLLVNNGVVNLSSYFLPLIEISDYYVKNHRLPGPARGSAGGFLISYLAGITQIDPIKYDLSTERFLTKDRVQQGNFPDIDWDSEGRELLVGEDGNSGFLKERFGDKYAQISTRNLLRIKSAILDANRFLHGEVQPEIQKFSKSLPNTPQGITDHDFIFGYESNDEHVAGLFEINEDLKKYAEERPKEWEIVKKAVSLSRQVGRHACAHILSSEPISNIVPVVKVGEIDQVTAFEAKECEKAGLIKYDFLVVSAIKDIRMCIDNINRKNGDKFEVGYFNHKGQKTYVWDVPEDTDVFNMMGMGETETVFQFNTTSVTPFVKEIRPKSIIELATITALVRPGPLDYIDKDTGRNMAEEYIERKRGRSFSDIKVLDKLIPETHSILVFQEQITKIAKELGGMSIVDAENVRIAMGKKKLKLMDSLKPKFIEGAKKVISEEEANKVWDMMATFGRYGFNKSHSVAYSVIGYTCAFLKYHYPLEWWAAVLTNADTKEINEVFYKYVKDIMLPPDINLSKEEITIDYEKQKLRQKLSAITGLGGKVAEKIIAARPFKDLKDFVIKKPCGPAMTRRLIYIGALDSLMPAEANTMLKKMWLYEETVKQVEWEAKIEELMKQPESEERNVKLQKLKDKGRSKAKIDPYYMVIDPLKDYLIKKEICPTMNLDLYELIKKYAKNLTIFPRNGAHMVIDNRGFEVYLAGPNVLEKMDSAVIDRNAYFCVPGYVIKAETFTYAKNTKKAYKLIIDSSGYISEKVIWPDYDTGELKYPKSLKKGCLAFFFYQKRAEKEGVNIYHSVVEVEGIDEDE
jgi:DNA-directed DNA polymerase III PolC